MAYDLYAGDAEDREAKAIYLMLLFNHARLQRVNYESQWEEAASLVWPEYRNTFTFGHMRAPGVKYTQFQVDPTGSIAASRAASIADMLMTPFNRVWSEVGADNDDLMRDRTARLYFSQWSRLLWAERYKPAANFHEQQQISWMALMVFGNQGMIPDILDTSPGGYAPAMRYMSVAPGELYLLVNHQGRVDGYIRHLRWVARQCYQRWGEEVPPQIKAAFDKADVATRWDILEFVLPRTDYDPEQIFSPRGKPWESCYLSVTGRQIMEEGGYYSFPLAHGRYEIAPEEWYGRGPTQKALPALKTKNAAVEAFLRAAVEGGDPIRLLPEDGLFDFKATAGNYVFGGVNADGKAMVQNLPPGDIQYNKEAMQECDRAINAAYFLDLYAELFDREGRPRSAREVIEASNTRNLFLGPIARQFGYLGDLVRREMVLLRQMRRAPPMPPVVREARGDFKVVFTSDMGRAANGQPIAGFMQMVEMMGEVAQRNGDNSVFDSADFVTAFPEMGQMMAVPERWMASRQVVAQKARGRAQAAERENYVRSLPGLAAQEKAHAITAKAQAGMNIGGTLSGMAPGGMPLLPQTRRPQPGAA